MSNFSKIQAIRSFMVSDLSDSLTSLVKKEGMSELLVFVNLQKTYQKYDFSKKILSESLIFCEKKRGKTSDSLIGSFIMSDLSESLTVAHLI